MNDQTDNSQFRSILEHQITAEVRRLRLSNYLLTEPLVLGVSGGADSLAMLHTLCALRGETAASTLHVAHLNHWFRGKEAREDAEFVREMAQAWGLSYTIDTFDVPNYARRFKLSQEDAARRVRYAFLASLARDRGAAVAVAHNADDQVETVLMSILRGTGIVGLAGMQMLADMHEPPGDEALARFSVGQSQEKVPLFRPMLHVWRHQILDYCKAANLQPRFDTTNWERIYKRNRVRHDLIPMLQMQYSLAVKSHLYNLAQIAQGENELVDMMVEQEWHRIASLNDDGSTVSLDCSRFASLPEALRRRLARRAILEVAGTLQDVTFEHIQAVAGIMAGDADSPRAMHLPHGLVVAHDGTVATIRKRNADISEVAHSEMWPTMHADTALVVEPRTTATLEGNWRFSAELIERHNLTTRAGELDALFDYDALLELDGLLLRTRQEGDFIQPAGMTGRKTLQDLMVDAKIPRELRNRIPILAIEGKNEALWVPGRGGRRSGLALLTEETRRVLHLRFSRQAAINP